MLTDVACWLTPGLTAGFVMLLWLRVAPRLASGLGFTAGFCLGYALLGSPLEPTRDWQWLPHLAVAATLAGPILTARRFRSTAGSIGSGMGVALALAVAAAWLVVPTWPRLDDVRLWMVGGGATLLLLLWCSLLPLSHKLSGTLVSFVITGVAIGAAIVLLQSGNARFAELAGMVAVVVAGCFAASLFQRQEATMPGLIPPAMLLLVGLMFLGKMNSFTKVPLASYVLIPLAPVALWLGQLPACRRWAPMWRIVLQVSGVVCVVGIGLALAILAHPPWLELESEDY